MPIETEKRKKFFAASNKATIKFVLCVKGLKGEGNMKDRIKSVKWKHQNKIGLIFKFQNYARFDI